VAIHDDELLGFCWLEGETAEVRFLDMDCPLPNDMLYLSRVWVHPTQRGKGLGRRLLISATGYAAFAGARRILSACVPRNERMKKLFADLGWTYAMRMDYIRGGPVMCFSVRRENERRALAFKPEDAARKLMSGIRAK
jgi:GNAT superfamily N-acetyltransferase